MEVPVCLSPFALRGLKYFVPAAPANVPLPPSFLPPALAGLVGDRHVAHTLGLAPAKQGAWALWLAAPAQRGQLEDAVKALPDPVAR